MQFSRGEVAIILGFVLGWALGTFVLVPLFR